MERKHWPYATKLTVSLLLLAFFVYLLSRFKEIIAPIIIAIIVAYILNPIVSIVHRKTHIHRTLSIILTYIILMVIIALIPITVISLMGENLQPLQISTQSFVSSVENMLAQQYIIAGITIRPSQLVGQLISSLQGLLQPVVGQTVNIIKNIVTSVIWIIFIIVISFYMVKDWGKFEKWVTSHLPAGFATDYWWIRDEINEIWSAFFRGQLLLSSIVAVIFIIAGLLLGLPYAIPMGFLAGILEFVPSLGHGIWLVIAALLAYFLGSTWIPLPHWVFMLIVIGLHLFYEQFDMNYLIPRVVGRRVHLPPLVIILGIVSGALLAGVIGIPLAAPAIASMRVVGRYIFSNLFDMEWKPVSAMEPLPPPKIYWWKRTPKKEKLP